MGKIKTPEELDNFKLLLKEFASSKEIKVKVKKPNKIVPFLKGVFLKKELKYTEKAPRLAKLAGITKINFNEVKETETANEYKIILSGKVGDYGEHKKISITFTMKG